MSPDDGAPVRYFDAAHGGTEIVPDPDGAVRSERHVLFIEPAGSRPARPSNLPDVLEQLYATWLAPNGIDEYLPVDATFVVGPGAWIQYTGFVWPEGRDGWDEGILLAHEVDRGLPDDPTQAALTPRHVPLRVPATDAVRLLFAQLNLALVEEP